MNNNCGQEWGIFFVFLCTVYFDELQLENILVKKSVLEDDERGTILDGRHTSITSLTKYKIRTSKFTSSHDKPSL